MGTFTSVNSLLNTLTGGTGAKELVNAWIDNRSGASAATTMTAGKYASLWTYNKSTGGTGAAPGSAANPTNTTVGGLLQANPGGGRQKYITFFSALSTAVGSVLLYDRLAHVSGLSGTTTTAQTFTLNSARYTGSSSVGNEIWLEVYTQIGATATTITASYTNQAGTSGRTTRTIAFGGTGNREATRLLYLPLQDGDTGVQSVQSVTLAASTGTAGDFGINIARKLVSAFVSSVNSMSTKDTLTYMPNLPEIKTDACLWPVFYAQTTTAPQIFIQLGSAEA